MPSCDPQKGGGRRRAMWRLSARAWAPRVWCSPTGGKERLCPASEKRWRAQIEYEIEGGRAGTSLTSRAGEEPRRGSKSYCLATYGHSPQISARSPHRLTRRSFNFRAAYPFPALFHVNGNSGLDSAPGTDSGGAGPLSDQNCYAVKGAM
jgi:hypothetical protein